MSDDSGEDPNAEDEGPVDQAAETINLSDPRSVRRSRDRQKRERQEADGLWRAVLADKIGRREMWRLLTEAHTFNTDFACGPNGFPQPEATIHNLGRQQWGLKLYHELLRIDHAAVHQMHVEHDPRFIVAKPARRQPE